MRAKLGPYASETALLYHLRAARGKVFWAVNTYFRAVLAEAVRRADFEPRRYAELANCQSTVTPACVREPNLITEQPTLESIPSSVLELVLQHTNLLTVCNAATVSTSLQKVAQSNSVWESLYNKRWCDATAPNDAAPQSDQAVQLSWHDKYRQKHSAEHHMQCPRCRQSKVVPIVYGFPSHLLVRNMRANKLRMGNDHLIEGQPIWTCTHCNEEFANFPYKSHELIRT